MSDIRELAMRFLKESGSVSELRGGAFIHADEFDYIVGAAMREGMRVSEAECNALADELQKTAIGDRPSADDVARDCAERIRAEADKLEGEVMNEQIKMPVRVHRDWHSAQWGCCDNCNTRSHVIDGICPACYDAEYQAERESAYSAELSRLRELVKEMREALADAAAEVESLSGQDNSCDPLADTSEYRAAIAKADAILGESGHE